LGFLALAVVAGVAATHIGQPDRATFSPAVVAAIPRHCDVYNSYNIGGYIILARPDVKVSIDTRNDMYGVDRVRESAQALRSRPRTELDGATCVLIPEVVPLARWLREDDNWFVAKSDGHNVLFVRS
jgi:hypothetical protein